MTRSPHVVLAGGGSAGHIEPALATADALRRLDPSVQITALGTERGLETILVPARGYDLALIPAVPLPRKPSGDLLRLPFRVRAAVARTGELLRSVGADVVVGFGGYVALPAYLAARRQRIPLVVHEQNPLPGVANKIGARFAVAVAVTMPGTPLPGAEVVGMPLRPAIAELDRAGTRRAAREHFGLDPERPTLLVTGGSQGARSLNAAVSAAAPELARAGVQVLHAIGKKNAIAVQESAGGPPYVVLPYLERMDLAYAAADLVLCRSGAVTCAELAAVGLPAAYVPLPHGNGEQRLNAQPIVDSGGGLLVDDAILSSEWITTTLVPVLADPARLAEMSRGAASHGRRDADVTLAKLVLAAAERAGGSALADDPDR
ncbi:MAG: undecaprenyldiphospho-muramoylpentapeptide beta-N-acetylglucosaminyltransferase [Actinobacteria bacterium]|nr:undecaprenyldiphospho-muramoylpentapeptide beta-N-acetylglucosaminyltransferase [Actinomycetota bacterium]